MKLSSLRVVHLRRRQLTDLATAAPLSQDSIPGAFFLDSCQRKLWVASAELLESAGVPADAEGPNAAGVETLAGVDAYEFLVRVASGLESEIVGETDIFGQLKEAWKNVIDPRTSSELGPWIQRIFEDTKEVRSRYLQNLGGGSYGTLVRKILRDQGARELSEEPILIVGAGQIARAVVPFLTENEIWAWNRSAVRLHDFRDEVGLPGMRLLSAALDEQRAWELAGHVVVCIPIDPLRDGPRIQARRAHKGLVIHLGAVRGQAGPWAQIPGFRSLDDLFEIQRSQGEVRSVQIARALRFCQERAQLRLLGTSVSISHGWEDLAVFG